MAVNTTPATDLRERLAAVRAAEAEAKAAREAAKAVRAPKAERPLVECGDGCGAMVRSRFLPGHDAKLKSRLLNLAHGDDEDAALSALETLASLGWERFFVPRKGK
ncbi:MAG TPA: hypothetical protein VFK94_06680 [Patescibacteria group bacterium]|nr:hypothetical protein [Patescibacteria group bacterium]